MTAHFGGRSRESLKVSRSAIDAAVKGATPEVASTLCTELFFAAMILAGSIGLRRAITDPSRDNAAKATLVTEIFGKTVDAKALGILTTISSLRWSSSGDLVQVIEQLAIEAQASAANMTSELDRVEDEFFATSQAISQSFDLRKALLVPDAVDAKGALIQGLLGKTATASTIKLVTHLVNNLHGRSIEAAFEDYLYALAARRNRVIAHVRVATALTDAQHDRLVAVLTAQVGQPVRVNLEIDPTIVGGVSVMFGDEIVDGTISNRIAGAGRAVVGAHA
ncbi:MAG: F0F1 ATP synthase subunit delta [Candidatus Nanopelagicaceae bacterium]|nr:F0F1 ATP synthase subunit delta [Candidatus Nanopelagicaceae bacterium]